MGEGEGRGRGGGEETPIYKLYQGLCHYEGYGFQAV